MHILLEPFQLQSYPGKAWRLAGGQTNQLKPVVTLRNGRSVGSCDDDDCFYYYEKWFSTLD